MSQPKGQALVDAIYAGAQKTHVGCDKPGQSLKILDTFVEETPETVAMTLVNAFDDKYDLISLLQATIEILSEEPQ